MDSDNSIAAIMANLSSPFQLGKTLSCGMKRRRGPVLGNNGSSSSVSEPQGSKRRTSRSYEPASANVQHCNHARTSATNLATHAILTGDRRDDNTSSPPFEPSSIHVDTQWSNPSQNYNCSAPPQREDYLDHSQREQYHNFDWNESQPSWNPHPSRHYSNESHANDHGQPPLPPVRLTSSKASVLLQSSSTAFSALRDLDPDDMEVQEATSPGYNYLKNHLQPQNYMHYANQEIYQNFQGDGGYLNYHQPYPYHYSDGRSSFDYMGGDSSHYHPSNCMNQSSPQRMPRHYESAATSFVTSPRQGEQNSTVIESQLWSTMKVGSFRPSNPMATLFNYVGEEEKRNGIHQPPLEPTSGQNDYHIIADRSTSPVSEVSMDSIFERDNEPGARYIEERADEYAEYREAEYRQVSMNGFPVSKKRRDGEYHLRDCSTIPESIEVPSPPVSNVRGIHRKRNEHGVISQRKESLNTIQRIVSMYES